MVRLSKLVCFIVRRDSPDGICETPRHAEERFGNSGFELVEPADHKCRHSLVDTTAAGRVGLGGSASVEGGGIFVSDGGADIVLPFNGRSHRLFRVWTSRCFCGVHPELAAFPGSGDFVLRRLPLARSGADGVGSGRVALFSARDSSDSLHGIQYGFVGFGTERTGRAHRAEVDWV